MGGLLSICTDPSGEANKPGAFTADTSNSNDTASAHAILVEGGPAKSNKGTLQAETKQQQEEQSRLQQQLVVVSSASRDMVSVRSMRGATYYHDQGFAAALSSHLQQTLPEPTTTPRLPPFSKSEAVVAILTRPIPALMQEPGWESMVRGKEELFANCPQLVESLL